MFLSTVAKLTRIIYPILQSLDLFCANISCCLGIYTYAQRRFPPPPFKSPCCTRRYLNMYTIYRHARVIIAYHHVVHGFACACSTKSFHILRLKPESHSLLRSRPQFTLNIQIWHKVFHLKTSNGSWYTCCMFKIKSNAVPAMTQTIASQLGSRLFASSSLISEETITLFL